MSDQDPKLPSWNPTMSANQGHMAHDRFGHDPGEVPLGGKAGRRKFLVVLGVILVVLLATVGIVWATSGGPAESVSEVADQAVDAAEGLDVDAGVDLLCDAPSSGERKQLEDLIASGQEASGKDDPEVRYEIANVEGEKEGSFQVTIYSEESGINDGYAVVQVDVGRDGDRSCIDGFDAESKDGQPPFDR